jgi:hypothetical protein
MSSSVRPSSLRGFGKRPDILCGKYSSEGDIIIVRGGKALLRRLGLRAYAAAQKIINKA